MPSPLNASLGPQGEAFPPQEALLALPMGSTLPSYSSLFSIDPISVYLFI